MPEHTQPIRRLPTSVEAAPQQLAASVALLADLEQHGPAMRWYQVAPPALLLGVGQRTSDVDVAACQAAAIGVYRRGSGGGAVLGGAELLLLDIALPRRHPLALGDITQSYRWLGEVWVEALASLGLPAQTVPLAEARADKEALGLGLKRVCFGGLSPYEVVADGRKLVGLAQIRRQSGALFQAGIYLRWDAAATAALIAQMPGEPPLAAQLAWRVAGLDSFQVPDDAAAVQRAVEQALTRQAGLVPQDAAWSVQEQTAQDTALVRYGERLV